MGNGHHHLSSFLRVNSQSTIGMSSVSPQGYLRTRSSSSEGLPGDKDGHCWGPQSSQLICPQGFRPSHFASLGRNFLIFVLGRVTNVLSRGCKNWKHTWLLSFLSPDHIRITLKWTSPTIVLELNYWKLLTKENHRTQCKLSKHREIGDPSH